MPPSPPDCPIPNSTGWVKPEGPKDAEICFIGEAAGSYEALKGRPFIGPAGGQLERILQMLGWERGNVRIGNTRVCHPPNDWLVGAPWENSPCSECDPALEALLSEPHKVFVTLGGTALRRVLGLKRERGKEPVKLENFHGAPVQDQHGRWIVPTFHPSFLLQGGQKFTKTVCFDLQVAKEVAQPGWGPPIPSMVFDPPLDWFGAWVAGLVAAADAEPGSIWLSIDTETPEKEKESDESALQREGGNILWVNLSAHPDEGITFPHVDPYREMLIRLLTHPGIIKVFWYAPFDVDAFAQDGIEVVEPIYDAMDMWHSLRPTHKRGLGYVAPFYSGGTGPWKHLGIKDPIYRCMDAAMTTRNSHGIAKDLIAEGLWDVFYRHHHLVDRLVLRPAEKVGVLFDRGMLELYKEKLLARIKVLESEIQEVVPDELKPLDGPYKTEVDGWGLQKEETLLVKVCSTCQAEEITKTHRCEDRSLTPQIILAERVVTRYYRREPFNPGSWKQILAYIKHRKHKPGKAKKTKKDTTDKKTLTRLVKTGDPLYSKTLEHRRLGKVEGTYASGMLKRLGPDNRVKPHFGHSPYTMRLNSYNPNWQNIDHDEEFRRCVVAAPGCKLLSLDYSGIEAVHVGWWSGDPDYVRLAKLGVHAYVESHLLRDMKMISEAASLKWSDADLRAHFKEIKARFKDVYEKSKRCVHGFNYGLTEFGMADYYPEVFPKRSDAGKVIAIYVAVCPKLKPYQNALRHFVHRHKAIGGQCNHRAQTSTAKYWELLGGLLNPEDPNSRIYHPFGYPAEFYGVLQYRKVKGEWKEYLGEDAKKVVAWPSQSSGAGCLAESELLLFDPERPRSYIGDAFFGQTPLRAPIHDELLLEVPEDKEDDVLAKAVTVMSRPIPQMPVPSDWGMGDYLTIGVAAKVGRNWAPYSEANPEGMRSIGVEHLASDVFREEEEEEEEA